MSPIVEPDHDEGYTDWGLDSRVIRTEAQVVEADPIQQRREQLVKLVSKTFYRELTEYGVAKDEVLAVANHLLDSLLHDSLAPPPPQQPTVVDLKIASIRDCWDNEKTLRLDHVELWPLGKGDLGQVAGWIQSPGIRESFVPALPADPAEIVQYFSASPREYLAIHGEGQLVGIIGAENIEPAHGRLEMKKLIGLREFRGRGIGTRATFLFLYYAFLVRDFHKVYIHSLDTNVHNLNVNSRLGFEVEGIFLEEFQVEGRFVNVVRMGLLASTWQRLFGEPR